MAIELVTGKAGVPHVDSEDVGAFNAHSLGSGAYILDGCEVSAKSANSINIAAGEILWEGRHIRVKGSGESLPIDNGQTGYNRRDLITLNYAKDPNGIESVSFKVVKGTATTGTAADPLVKVGSILAGDTSAVIPFARIALSGLSVATPTVLLGSLPNLASLRDSVSQLSVSNVVALQSGITYEVSGNVVIVNAYNVTYSGGAPLRFGPMPTGLRPSSTRYGIVNAGSNSGIVFVDTRGNIDVWAGSNGTYTGQVVYTVLAHPRENEAHL